MTSAHLDDLSVNRLSDCGYDQRKVDFNEVNNNDADSSLSPTFTTTSFFSASAINPISLSCSRSSSSVSRSAVKVRNLNVNCGLSSDPIEFILNNVSMTVPKGCIYGLLGPSGCGKTTLIKCIMGLKSPDGGEIAIFNYPTGTRESGVPGPGVGYMPQETALSGDLTIRETWTFFGRVNFLSREAIAERIDSLISLLDLPSPDAFISSLSGGQQRRVSFGVTILHNPRLLILDEPTVGVDPVLRSRIWRQLINTTRSSGATVIITTHYIEETRRADMVGFMRKGAIIAENSPTHFMSRYKVNTLEAVFHRLCYIHKRSSLSGGPIRGSDELKSTNLALNHISSNQHTSETKNTISTLTAPWIRSNGISDSRAWWTQFHAIVTKYTKQITRQPETLIASLVLPVIVLLTFCVCIGSTPNGVPIGLINQENCDLDYNHYHIHGKPHQGHNHSHLAETAIRNIDPADADEPCLGSMFFDSINNYMFDKRYYTDYHEAIDDATSGKIWGVVRIRNGFTNSLASRLAYQEVDLDSSTIQVNGDLTALVKTRLVVGSLSLSLLDTIVPTLPNPRLAELPIRLGATVFGSFSRSDFFGVRDFAAPGLMIVIVYCIGFALTTFTLLLEKQEKTLDRNYSAGLGRSQIILGQLVTRFIFIVIPVIILLALSTSLFGVPCRGSFVAAAALLLLQTLSGMSLGIFMSTVLPSIFTCAVVANGVLLITFLISGVMWSIDTLPYYLRWISVVQPTTAAAESLRSILIRGLPITQQNVYFGYLTSAAWVGIWLILSTITFGLQNN